MRFTLALIVTLIVGVAARAERPNIVYIMADDLGWKDVGYHKSVIKTPNIDKLAAAGVRLERFYVQPVCSPTRAAMMTGRYPIRQGLQVGVIRPFADYGLPLDEVTIADVLQKNGYFTSICGKWHLGLHAPEFLPTRRGFTHQYGHYCGAIDYYKLSRDGGHDWHRNDEAVYPEPPNYSTTLIGQEAVKIIRKHAGKTPLFLYVPFNAPHSPLQVPEKYLKDYEGIKGRKRRMYAGMVACMDEMIGDIVKALDEKGVRKNTLIVFHSDNGGPERIGADNGPLRGGKGQLFEGGVRVPALMNWKGKLKPGVSEAMIHVTDMAPTLVKLAGGELKTKHALDGMDVWPAIAEGEPSPRNEILHNIAPKGAALRVGDFKLIAPGKGRAQLFNVVADPGEENDLASSEPAKVRQLRKRLKTYRDAAAEAKGGRRRKPKGFKTPKVWGER